MMDGFDHEKVRYHELRMEYLRILIFIIGSSHTSVDAKAEAEKGMADMVKILTERLGYG